MRKSRKFQTTDSTSRKARKRKKRHSETVEVVPSGVKPKKGQLSAHLTPGNPGHDGRAAGRYPNSNWLSKFARRVLRSKGTRKAIRRSARDHRGPAFSTMIKELGRRGYGEVPREVDARVHVSLEELVTGSYKQPKEKK